MEHIKAIYTKIESYMGGLIDLILEEIFYCVDGETKVTVLGKEHVYKKPVSEDKRVILF